MKQEMLDIIKMSWTKETSDPNLQEKCNNINPCLGQSLVTSLVVNDFCGGKIFKCMINGISHYYNLINDKVIDLTSSEFESIDYETGEERNIELLLANENVKTRYKQLLKNTKINFNKYGTINYKLRDEYDDQYLSKIPGTFGGHKKLKIYGRLDCPSALKWIAKGYYIDNRVFFKDEQTAIKAGYRPCSVCMKKEYKIWKQNH